MSKPTSPLSWAGVMTEVIDGLGAEYAAAAIDRGLTTVYNYADPNHPSGPTGPQMTALDSAWLDAGLGTEGPFYRHMRRLHTKAASKAPPRKQGEPLQMITHAVKEFGEGVTAFSSLVKQGRCSHLQVIEAEREITEAIKALQEIRDEARHMSEHYLQEVV